MLTFSFFLDKKRNKKIKEKRMLPEARSGQARLFSRATHKDTDWLENAYWSCNDSARPCCSLSGNTGGTAFSPGFVYNRKRFIKGEKEVLENIF